MYFRGDVRLNGKPYTKHLLKEISGYVMQDDLVHATLTVSETLEYTAALRMSPSLSKAERRARCTEVLGLMGIAYCGNVIVGDSRRKGVSGGERKRLCVAMELLTRPSLLFLDEPTSGLDSTTSLGLVETLKQLTTSGSCTILCTIHQPQTKIFELLDNLLLMKKGEIVYQGDCSRAELYFAEQGYPCNAKMNPADHMMDLVTPNGKVEATVKKLKVDINMEMGSDKPAFVERLTQPWVNQFLVLCHRNMREKVRRWDIIATNAVITIIVAAFIGCGAWRNIGTDASSIPKRIPSLFFCVIHQGVVSTLQGG